MFHHLSALYMRYFTELQAATLHYKEMEEQARCARPVPVVVRIRDISNAASKVYFPECTIIHHCRADAGCCNETSTCASRTNNTITRSFFVSMIKIKLTEYKGQERKFHSTCRKQSSNTDSCYVNHTLRTK